MNKTFILAIDFDGDCNKLINLIASGEAIKYNDMPIPIKNAYMQGERLFLPLPHRLVVFDLKKAFQQLKHKPIVKLQICMQR